MAERPYVDEIPSSNPYNNTPSIPIQAEPGEFNPYLPRDAAYAFTTSDLHIHDPAGPIYQPSQEGQNTPEHPYATTLPSNRRPSSSQSFYRDNAPSGVAY